MMTTRQVDEQGRCSGFWPTDDELEIGPFGEGLQNEVVELDDGRIGTVAKVYSYIQTGQAGTSNYVAVDIEIDDDDEPPITPHEQAWIDQAILDYAIHHGVETDAVFVLRNFREGRLVGFLLSLDRNGHSRGCDEKFGQW
jgi:hypothetical protein